MKKRTNPLTRRIPRELAGDWRKYLVVFLFLVLTIGFVSGMYVANESMMRASVDGVTTYKLEYGHFELSRAADDTLLAAIETGDKADVRQFYTDKARRELNEKFPGEFRGQFDSEFHTKFDAEFQNQVKQTLLAGGLDADTAAAMLDTAVAQAKADGTYQSAYSSAYQSAYTSAYNEAYNEAWAKIADEIDEKYADAEEKYDLNDPDFQAVPVTLYENFYRNEDEDHDNDGTSDGTIRVYTQTNDVNLACL
ncbi:MAG: permease, partial [Oscillospiraceae bacterium]|nr:permease [Oscillospiraceae bacterium]